MAFVVTAGQLRSVQRPSSSFVTGNIAPQIALSPTVYATYDQLWRTQPALRTVVSFLARNVAQLGIDTYRKVSQVDRVKLSDHPVARLLERPQPGSKWTKYRLLNTIMHDLCIYDDAYLLKLRSDEGVYGLAPVSPRMMTPAGNDWFGVDFYRLSGTSGYIDIPADNVVHIHGYNPTDPRRGAPPVETLRSILAEEHAATIYREQMWRNGARVAGYIQRPKDAPKWSPEGRDRFRRDWQAQYTGDGPATGGTPVLEDGMSFVQSGVTPKDAQYVESRKLTREECAVAYHISPVMIGLLDRATFNNVTELHKMLYQDTLAPYLAQISQDLEAQLLEDVDPSAKDGSVYIEFNLAEKLRGSFEEQAASMQTAVGAPWMTRDEARAMFNLPHIDGAEELITPLNVVTGGLASPRDTAPPPKSSTRDVLRAFLQRQGAAVMSRMGASGELEWDADRWDRELAADLKAAGAEFADSHARDINADTHAALIKALGNPAALEPRAVALDVFRRRQQEETK